MQAYYRIFIIVNFYAMRVRVTQREIKKIQRERQQKTETTFILFIPRYCFQ